MIQLRTTRTAEQPRRRRQAGLSMIELLIAMVVLMVGMMGSMILVRTAIVNNNRNKLDTTATALAQTVLEQILARPATANLNPGGNLPTLTDCAGVTSKINPGVGGATLVPSGFNQGNIDFSQDLAAVPAGYAMLYVTCGPANQQVTYEIRWNVTAMTTGFTKLVTVSARKRIATNTSALPFFTVPVTLRGIAGQ